MMTDGAAERREVEQPEIEQHDERRLHTDQLAGTTTASAHQASPTATAQQPVPRKTEDSVRAETTPLFASNDAERFRERWSAIQSGFVDEPRSAVEQADALVAEVMQRLAQIFADERSELEKRWAGGGDTDTEKLRVALRRYRSFFDRLLAM